MKGTFFETTMLLFDDGKDQILFDANITRPSLWKYVVGAPVKTDKKAVDRLMKTYDFSRVRSIFVSHTHPDHALDIPYIAKKTGAEVMFLGVGTMAKWPEEKIETFYRETLDKVRPQKVIPLHWDDFFTSLDKPVRNMPRIADDTLKNFDSLARACAKRDMELIIQYPFVTLEV